MSRAKPRWGWTGAAELSFSGSDERVCELLAMLPAKKSSDEEFAAYLVDLGAHFQRWLHQDEFGTDRGQQGAALRALKKSVEKLQQQLEKDKRSLKGKLDARLMRESDPSSPMLQAVFEATVDLARGLKMASAPKLDLMWAARLGQRADRLMAQAQSPDTNADDELLLHASRQKFDSNAVVGHAPRLTDVERWLDQYRHVLDATLNALTKRKGPAERSSLKLLVEQLCELWQRETGQRVTAHGQRASRYTGQPETAAGRFVTAAVEAMLPDQSWFDAHVEFTQSSRATTHLPSRKADRARQILAIMRDFVHRQELTHGKRRRKKMGSTLAKP